MIIIQLLSTIFAYRRAALQIWKQKLGSRATYRELIGVFERAGYRNYVDTIHEVVFDGKVCVIIPTPTKIFFFFFWEGGGVGSRN